MLSPNSTPRARVLVISHPDGHLEVFGEQNIDVLIQRVPRADSDQGRCIAEDVVELLLPLRFKNLYWPNKCRARGTTRPLTADTLQQALFVGNLLSGLNGFVLESRPEQKGEVVTWT